MTFTWQPYRVGGGGFLRSLDVHVDGTAVVRADTYGAYIYNSATSSWDQLVTTARMPSSAYSSGLTIGGEGGVYEIRIAPSNSSRIYMTYLDKVYRSDDKGLTFSVTGFSPQTMSPNNGVAKYGPKMAIDPANADIVYLITDSAGLWKSTDAGVNWSHVTAIANNDGSAYGCVAFDASQPGYIYASASGTGLYRSTDAGVNWTLLTSTPTDVVRVKIHSDGVVYVVTLSQTLKKLVGTTWSTITPPDQSGQIDNVILDPASAAHIIAVNPSGYMEDSSDRGGNWNGVNFIKSRLCPDAPYLGTIFNSIGSGSEASYFFGIGDIAINQGDSNKIWMTGGQAVFTTPAFVQSPTNQVWTSKAAGIEQLVADQIVSPPGGNPVLASWDVGIIQKSYDPDAYAIAQAADLTRAINRCNAIDYASSDPTFLASVMNQVAEASGFSTDRGKTWQQFAAAPPFVARGQIGGSIACATPLNMVMVGGQNANMFNTKDGGATWTARVPSGVPASSTSDTSIETGFGFSSGHKRFIVAADRVTIGNFAIYNYGPSAASSAKGVYTSVDGGDTWTHAFTNWLSDIPSSGDNSFNAKLRYVPRHAGVAFFTGGPQGASFDAVPHTQSFWKTTDNCVTWNAVADVLEVWDFGFGAPVIGTTEVALYIYGWVSGVGGIFRSSDLGSTWTQLSDLHPGGWVDTLACISGDMNTPSRVYVGFYGSGYIYGTDNLRSGLRLGLHG